MRRKAVADWPRIKLAFVTSNKSVPELAWEFGVNPQTLKKQVERNSWNVERIKFEQESIAKAAEEAAERRVSELLQFNSDDLKVAKAIRARVARRLGAVDVTIGAAELRMLASAAEAAQRMGRLALGASTDNFGHAGQDGQGPVAVTDVPIGDYLKAREKALGDF